MNTQIEVIETHWPAICPEAKLSPVDQNYLWRRQFLNPFAFYDAPDQVRVPQS